MKMKKKPYNPEDQEKVRKCIKLIQDLVTLNKQFEINIFISAMGNIMVTTYMINGNTKKEFIKSLTEMAEAYKDEWPEE